MAPKLSELTKATYPATSDVLAAYARLAKVKIDVASRHFIDVDGYQRAVVAAAEWADSGDKSELATQAAMFTASVARGTFFTDYNLEMAVVLLDEFLDSNGFTAPRGPEFARHVKDLAAGAEVGDFTAYLKKHWQARRPSPLSRVRRALGGVVRNMTSRVGGRAHP